jgi:hypothetical protein
MRLIKSPAELKAELVNRFKKTACWSGDMKSFGGGAEGLLYS